MKDGYKFKTIKNSDYNYLTMMTVNKKIENFMTYLKDSFDYDQVTLYTYDYINKDTDIRIIDEAINFILTALYKEFDIDPFNEFKERLFSYSDSIQVVRLTRRYLRHEEHHYLFINSSFENNDVIITIPAEFNYIGLLKCNLIYLPSSNHQFISMQRRKSLYDDCSHYIVFKENLKNGYYFEVLCEINMFVNNFCPVLSYEAQQKNSEFETDRKAQLVIRRWIDTVDYRCEYMCTMQLIKANDVIKECNFKEDISVKFQLIMDKFIFPLAESYELINSWELDPSLTAEFMSHDYESYWELKQMVEI